jgi:hypothetical protein
MVGSVATDLQRQARYAKRLTLERSITAIGAPSGGV